MDAFTGEAMQYDTKPRLIDNVSDISVLLPYTTACRRIVHTLKYRGMPSIGFIMGKLMAQKTLSRVSLSGNAVLVPVPLHPDRLRERGYNQSERLAQGFASFSGHEIFTDIIKRIRKTETQTALDHEQRAQNVQNAFIFSGDISLSNREVILIDDVMTTGSTISACAEALRKGGAERITVSVLATPDPGTE
jgi:ComF family protein